MTTYTRVRSWTVEPSVSAPAARCGHCHRAMEPGETLTTVAHNRRATAQPDHADAFRHCCEGCAARILGYRSPTQEVLV